MDEQAIRAQNLWSSFARKIDPLDNGMELVATPALDAADIGGLDGPKEEVATYACAATSPHIYQSWGTQPPSGILFMGQRGSGKRLLAEALATQTDTSFLVIDVPRLVLDVIHAGKKASELVQGWSDFLEEMPRLTVFFDELEFSQAQEIGERRPDLPVGPIMDFLLEIIDRTIRVDGHLVVAATSHPDSLREAFVVPGRFERLVEVRPRMPEDVVAALQIHARAAEKRAGRSLFESVQWERVVVAARDASIGDWVRILHAVLRRKARCEAAGEETGFVTTVDVQNEVERFTEARRQIRSGGGNYV
ncbi:MAG: AAA family ATPase [Myxococcota bacterium]|nr:26S protease regulatory subunit [Myxococcales bacterium]